MSTSRVRRTLGAFAAAASLGLGMIATTAPAATAAPRDGYCEPGEFCYFHNSISGGYFHGSGSDFRGSISNYGSTQPGCYEFRSPGTGRGHCVKNDAAAYWNRTNRSVRIYFNSGFGGRYITVAPGAAGNLPVWLKNNNASHKFL